MGDWSVSLEGSNCPCGRVLSDEYPVCMRTDGMHFDIARHHAADLASFLMAKHDWPDDDMYFSTRQGTCRAIWMKDHVLLAGSWLSTVRVPKGAAKELGALMASVLKAKASSQLDPLAGAKDRTDRNLRSMFFS